MENINPVDIYSKSIEEGARYLHDNYTTLSDEEYRKLYENLVARFLKEEFNIDSINSLSNEECDILFEKLLSIEINDSIGDIGRDESAEIAGESYRGLLASSIITEFKELTMKK